MYFDKSNKRRVTGPIEFAIDGKEETVWGADIGPGPRNLPRKAVFTLEKPIENPGSVTLNFYLAQKHGGWNSDDNMNHNPGRFRLSLTSAESPVADPLPVKVREILAIAPDKRSEAQTQAVFAY